MDLCPPGHPTISNRPEHLVDIQLPLPRHLHGPAVVSLCPRRHLEDARACPHPDDRLLAPSAGDQPWPEYMLITAAAHDRRCAMAWRRFVFPVHTAELLRTWFAYSHRICCWPDCRSAPL